MNIDNVFAGVFWFRALKILTRIVFSSKPISLQSRAEQSRVVTIQKSHLYHHYHHYHYYHYYHYYYYHYYHHYHHYHHYHYYHHTATITTTTTTTTR